MSALLWPLQCMRNYGRTKTEEEKFTCIHQKSHTYFHGLIKTFWVFHNSSMCSLLVFGLEFGHVQRFFSFWKGYFYLIKFHSQFHFNCPSSNLFQKIGQSICKRGRQGGVKENLFWLMCTPIRDLTHAGHWNIRKAKKETNKHSNKAPPTLKALEHEEKQTYNA